MKMMRGLTLFLGATAFLSTEGRVDNVPHLRLYYCATENMYDQYEYDYSFRLVEETDLAANSDFIMTINFGLPSAPSGHEANSKQLQNYVSTYVTPPFVIANDPGGLVLSPVNEPWFPATGSLEWTGHADNLLAQGELFWQFTHQNGTFANQSTYLEAVADCPPVPNIKMHYCASTSKYDDDKFDYSFKLVEETDLASDDDSIAGIQFGVGRFHLGDFVSTSDNSPYEVDSNPRGYFFTPVDLPWYPSSGALEWTGHADNLLFQEELHWRFTNQNGTFANQFTNQAAIVDCPPRNYVKLYYCAALSPTQVGKFDYSFKLKEKSSLVSESDSISGIAFGLEPGTTGIATMSKQFRNYVSLSEPSPFQVIKTGVDNLVLSPDSVPWSRQARELEWTGYADNRLVQGELYWNFRRKNGNHELNGTYLEAIEDCSETQPASVLVNLYYCPMPSRENPGKYDYSFKLEDVQGRASDYDYIWDISIEMENFVGVSDPSPFRAVGRNRVSLIPRTPWFPASGALEWYGYANSMLAQGELIWRYANEQTNSNYLQAILDCDETSTEPELNLYYCPMQNQSNPERYDYSFKLVEETGLVAGSDHYTHIGFGVHGEYAPDTNAQKLRNYVSLSEPLPFQVNSSDHLFLHPLEMPWYPQELGALQWTGYADNLLQRGELYWQVKDQQWVCPDSLTDCDDEDVDDTPSSLKQAIVDCPASSDRPFVNMYYCTRPSQVFQGQYEYSFKLKEETGRASECGYILGISFGIYSHLWEYVSTSINAPFDSVNERPPNVLSLFPISVPWNPYEGELEWTGLARSLLSAREMYWTYAHEYGGYANVNVHQQAILDCAAFAPNSSGPYIKMHYCASPSKYDDDKFDYSFKLVEETDLASDDDSIAGIHFGVGSFQLGRFVSTSDNSPYEVNGRPGRYILTPEDLPWYPSSGALEWAGHADNLLYQEELHWRFTNQNGTFANQFTNQAAIVDCPPHTYVNLYYCAIPSPTQVGKFDYSFKLKEESSLVSESDSISGIAFGLEPGTAGIATRAKQFRNYVSLSDPSPYQVMSNNDDNLVLSPDSVPWSRNGEALEWTGYADNRLYQGELYWDFQGQNGNNEISGNYKEAIEDCSETQPASVLVNLYYCAKPSRANPGKYDYSFKLEDVEGRASDYDYISDITIGDPSHRLKNYVGVSHPSPFRTFTGRNDVSLLPGSPWFPASGALEWHGYADSMLSQGGLIWRHTNELIWRYTNEETDDSYYQQAILDCDETSPEPELNLYYCPLQNQSNPERYDYSFKLVEETGLVAGSDHYTHIGFGVHGEYAPDTNAQKLRNYVSLSEPLPFQVNSSDHLFLHPLELPWYPKELGALQWTGYADNLLQRGELYWQVKDQQWVCPDSLTDCDDEDVDDAPSSLKQAIVDCPASSDGPFVNMYYCARASQIHHGQYEYSFKLKEETGRASEYGYILGISFAIYSHLYDYVSTSINAPFDSVDALSSNVFSLSPISVPWNPYEGELEWTGYADNLLSAGEIYWTYAHEYGGYANVNVHQEAILDCPDSSPPFSSSSTTSPSAIPSSLPSAGPSVTATDMYSDLGGKDMPTYQNLTWDASSNELGLTDSDVTVDLAHLMNDDRNELQNLTFDPTSKKLGLTNSKIEVNMSSFLEKSPPQELTYNETTMQLGLSGSSSEATVDLSSLAQELTLEKGNNLVLSPSGSKVDLSLVKVVALQASIDNIDGKDTSGEEDDRKLGETSTEDLVDPSSGKPLGTAHVGVRRLEQTPPSPRRLKKSEKGNKEPPLVQYGGSATSGWTMISDGRLVGMSITANGSLEKGTLEVRVVECSNPGSTTILAAEVLYLYSKAENRSFSVKFSLSIPVQEGDILCFEATRRGDIKSAKKYNAASLVLLLEQW